MLCVLYDPARFAGRDGPNSHTCMHASCARLSRRREASRARIARARFCAVSAPRAPVARPGLTPLGTGEHRTRE